MSKKDIKPSSVAFEVLEGGKGLSRRDALKIMGIGGAATLIGNPIGLQAEEESKAKSDKKINVLIVGGGAGGIMALARLHSALSNADFTIIAPNDIHLYQPGQVFMAAGLYRHDDVVKQNKDFIPSDVNWIKDEVASFDPDNNKVLTRGGKEVVYDYMVVATGIVYHYERIKGLTKEDIGTNGISSVYLNNLEKGTTKGGEVTWKWFNELKEAAKDGKKPTVIYTQPNTPIKCGGAPQKILYLSADHLKKEGLGANFIFATNGGKLFGLPTIAASLDNVQKRYDKITNKFKHNLIAIDVANKVATFEERYEEKGEYDKDLEEYTMIPKTRTVDIKYDFIHVVPPMAPPKAVVESKLGWQKGTAKGWLEVDKHTLQHRRYKNIFGIGDVCGIPKGKTGGSARHHGPILTENFVAAVNGRALEAKFDGYTVCPLKTQYGEIILAEFNYDGLAPSFPLDPAKPRWIWWAFDLYMLKPMYWHLMLRGWM